MKGWNTIPSNEFTVSPQTNGIMLNGRGRGRGHLVGMCQQQAKELSNQGWHFSEILKLFYPDSQLSPI